MQRAPRGAAPPLVLVTGAPGAGKSTLAEWVGEQLDLPVLSKDALKEAISGAVAATEDVVASARLGVAAYAALYALAEELLRAGLGVVVESNFRRGLSEEELGRLLRISNARLIYCTAPAEVVLERYRERAAAGLRHPVHFDAEREAALADDLERGRFDHLDLACPALSVDTTSGWRPEAAAILRFLGGEEARGR